MKKISIIFLRIVSIIDMLGIMLASFLSFGGLLTCIILCILFILIQSDFNKIVDKLGINIMIFLLLIPFLAFGGICIYCEITYSTSLSRNWNNIKVDFQIINEQTIEYFENIDDTIKGADAVMIMTEWNEIKSYDLNNYEKLMKSPNVYDGRNCYALEEVKKTKIRYRSIGR